MVPGGKCRKPQGVKKGKETLLHRAPFGWVAILGSITTQAKYPKGRWPGR
jgi:hypothetical protein